MYLSQKYLDDLMVRMAYHNAALEGNRLSADETRAILKDKICPASRLKDVLEIVNYPDLFREYAVALDDRAEISPELIKTFHRVMCSRIFACPPGEFKTCQNHIRGARFEPTPPGQVVPALTNWCGNLSYRLAQAQTAGERIAAIAEQHIRFETIHPFSDGNGRVGRALMVYSCLRERLPPAVIEFKDREQYLMMLGNYDSQALGSYCLSLMAAENTRLKQFETDARGCAVIIDAL